MSLIKCRECGYPEMSDQAPNCPHCGAPNYSRKRLLHLVITEIALGLLVAGACWLVIHISLANLKEISKELQELKP